VTGQLPSWRIEAVPQEPMALWAKLLRDANPIHVDPAAAEALGFGPRTVNPGPINLAYALNMVMAARPGNHPREIHARFSNNILSGDAVEVSGVADFAEPGRCCARVRVPERDATAMDVEVRLVAREDFR